MSLALAILNILPQLLQSGFAIEQLATHGAATAVPATPVEDFAAKFLGAIPALMSAGVDVLPVIEHANASVKTMLDEQRNPTSDEWDALDAFIKGDRQTLHAA